MADRFFFEGEGGGDITKREIVGIKSADLAECPRSLKVLHLLNNFSVFAAFF